MKKVIGLLVLLLALAVLSGCTQPPVTPATPTATPSATEATPVPTTVMATVATPAVTPAPAANISTTAVPTAKPAAVTTSASVNVTSTATIAPSATKVVTVNILHIRNGSFEPSATTVLPGTGVTWINDDTKVHIVKASGARPGMFNSGEILPTAQFSYTFGEDEGVFTFTDLKDPGMNGTIIVKKGASIVGAPPIQATLSPT